MSTSTWKQRLIAAKNAFKNAIYGEEVRNSLVEVADVMYEAIDEQVVYTDTDLTDSSNNAAAQAAATGLAINAGKQDTTITEDIITGDFLNVEWLPHTYVSNEDGTIHSTDLVRSTTKHMIRVPENGVLAIHFFASSALGSDGYPKSTRIVKYNADGSFISYVDYVAPGDVRFSIDDAAFVRVQYAAIESAEININNYVFIRVDYENGIVAHQEEVEQKVADDVYDTVSKTGNPIVLENTSYDMFKNIDVENPTANTKLTVCGKNIFNIRDYGSIVKNFSGGACNISKNNVKFVFIPSTGVIRILNESVNGVPQPASAATTSADENLKINYKTLNGHTFWHNFKFKFPVDTVVSVSDNAIDSNDYFPPANSGRTSVVTPVHLPFNTGVQMRIYDATGVTDGDDYNFIDTSYRVINGGVSFTAKAGIEYGVYFVVQKGFLGDITFRPQIEVGNHITAYERFAGYVLSGLNSESNTNLFQLQNSDSSAIRSEDGSLTAIFNKQNNNIYISNKATDSDATRPIVPSTHNTDTDGAVLYITKFTGDGNYHFVSGIPRTKDRAVVAQIFSEIQNTGTEQNPNYVVVNPIYDVGDGAIILTKSGVEYKYRILLKRNVDFNGTISPVIKKQYAALSVAKSFAGKTTLFTNDGASISATAKAMRNSENIANSAKIAERINILTGGRILDEPEKRRPMISFIDDDTTNYELVEEYHGVCSTAGLNDTPILGGFAVETQHLEDSARLLSDLLDYEKEGYACLYHCLEQISTSVAENTWYWVDNPNHCDNTKPEGATAYNETLIRNNFVEGLLKMREFGFINWQYWVTPYGVNNEFIQSLAKQYGMKCLISFQSRITEFNAFVSRYGNIGKWDIPRFHYNYDTNYIEGAEDWPYSYKDLKLKNIIDATVADKGWLIVTTHANTWPEDTAARNAMKYRFKKMVRYAQTAGMEVVPFPVGFETFKPYLDMHDLLK